MMNKFHSVDEALANRNAGNEAVDLLWQPEYTNYGTCPACMDSFRYPSIMDDKKCPSCGQRFRVEIYIT